MTYSTHAIDALNTGEAAMTPYVSAPVRSSRRRRHAHAMSYAASGARIAGFGI